MMARKQKDLICIDEDKSLVFSSESELYNHFKKEIETLENEFYAQRKSSNDLAEKQFTKYDENLEKCLNTPDEIWNSNESVTNANCSIYIKLIDDDKNLFHVALVYTTHDVPTFVYLHFPTTNEALLEKYRRGTKIYDRYYENAPMGSIDGDALMESDPLAVGLFNAMLKLRGESDIKLSEFIDYADMRDVTIQEADEIWRTNESMGNTLVTFIKDFSEDQAQKIIYVVVTIEDQQSNSHTLLFSFPTIDESLSQRYRHGENLQAEEVTQESSH